MSTKKEVSLFGSKGGDNSKKIVDNEFEGKNAHVADLEENFLVMGTGKALRKKGTGKKEVEKLDIDFRFKKGGGGGAGGDDRPRRGGGRDGRSDRRGGDNRRSGAGGRGRDSSFALDSNAFPSLE